MTLPNLKELLRKFDSEHSLRDYKFMPGLVSEALPSEFEAACAELFSAEGCEDVDVSAL